jgi:hypothetical protein
MIRLKFLNILVVESHLAISVCDAPCRVRGIVRVFPWAALAGDGPSNGLLTKWPYITFFFRGVK